MNKYKKVVFALFVPVMMLAVGLPVLADDSSSNTDTGQTEAAKETAKKEAEAKAETAKKAAEAKHEAAKQAAETKREAAKQEAEKQREAAKQELEKKREAAKNELEQKKDKLKDDKLKICQERQDHISSSMTTVASRGQEKIDLFTKIAERTEAFYVSKGKVLSNYNDLVTAVNSQKTAAQATVDSVKASSDDFKCDSDNPKGTANLFKVDVEAMNNALKSYRTAVKDLIVGVKSVQSTTAAEGTH